MRIGIDYGDVITDTAKLKSEITAELWDVHVEPLEFDRQNVVGTGKLTTAQYHALQILIYRTSEFGTDRMKPIPQALEFLIKLKEEGHELSIVSTRGDIEAQLATEWLNSRNIDLPFYNVGINNTKTERCKENGLEVFLDDELSELKHLEGIVPYRFLLRNKPGSVVPDGITQVYTWLHFYDEIRKLP